MFITASRFHPSLIFAGKIRRLPQRSPLWDYTLRVFLANIKKCTSDSWYLTNTLALYGTESIKTIKSFILQPAAISIVKVITAILNLPENNKLV
jgi:hypothetical protein